MAEPRGGDNAESIVIFGAGNIGRSFIGQIFSRAGFDVTFVDLDRELVDELNRHGSYTVIHRDPSGREESLEIGPVRAVDGGDVPRVSAVLAGTKYVATAVGANALPGVLPVLAREMEHRSREGIVAATPLDIILAENIHGAGRIVREAVPGAGVVECSVGKMVPIVPRELRQRNIRTVYAEAYNTLIVDREGWKNPIPAVPELLPVAPIEAWIGRKLYIHNLGHAACAYLAHAAGKDIRYIREATIRSDIRERTRQVMMSSAEALLLEYPGVFTEVELSHHVEDLLYRFSSRSLGDTVYRVGRDLRRKLGPSERVLGALRLLQRHHRDTTRLEEVYRAALLFRAGDDQGEPFPADRELLDRLEAAGTDEKKRILAEISGFELQDPDDRALVERLLA